MPANIRTEKSENSRLAHVDLENIVFGRVFTDHMLVSDYSDSHWHDTRIVPFQNLSLSPATTALHYGQEIFEGLKAYKNKDGNVNLFRPEMNWKRMNESARRMCMPEIPEDIFMDGLKELIAMDRDWVPTVAGGSLYIRPFMFASDEYVGIKTSDDYKFIIFSSPVNSYYSEPIKVKVSEQYVRAAPGGTGEAKTAGNYAASLYAAAEANKEGYRQMLWTDCIEHKWIEESGTMNVFFVIGDTVVTPPLEGTILHGITRDSVLTLLRDNGYKVEERRISIDEVAEAAAKGELKEAFGAGTAATIAHIIGIGYKGREISLPAAKDMKISNWLLDTLQDIKTGVVPDKYGWLVRV